MASADLYSGHDFRNRLLVEHYSRALAVGDRVRYVTAEEYPATGADWVIVESLGEPPQPSVSDPRGRRFVLDGTYRGGDLSGNTWHLYRRDAGT